ncbi:AAA family ATPase [Nostoc sp. UHCC 0251]|uniref:trifunctional serine/threonine-protein kinase/ATP-binding protein/sensor histidine kinase n=1 Tax=Nostoc sp. UHCC 0251 TaxID=3110240 RepID=UPI002B1F5D5A|nr:AAA family ATPase [Nostoc sp. UHCC 0251]MEA5627528.1 AAA family ATPase [Nostoc sp. UHCC 0251]
MTIELDWTVVMEGYQVVEQLYFSSRTIVYRGIRDIDLRPVIIKYLKRDYPSFRELLQFRNQYTITKNLNLPGVVQPYSLETYRNSYALVMPDYGGISLWQYIKIQPLKLSEFLAIAIHLADILNGLYQHRVIHKDIKPANIVIHPETKQVKLIDFSIASLLPRETQEIKNLQVLEGTLAYLSPEQTGRMNRGIDYRSDFYSLGVTFFELLTGQLPFQSNDPMELIHCHIAKQPEQIRGGREEEIPQMISEIVMKLMAKNAEDRYQSALGLKHDLEICLAQLKETGKIETFPIAQRDVCDRFLIPEKLYGRETEVATLLQAFDRISGGSTEIMLVVGFSGIGKTAIVNEVHKPIVRQRGYFIKGKFDQFGHNTPFSAFVLALRDLMAQLLTETDAQLQQWQTKILSALGDNGQVIIEVIPELEQIIGKQPPTPELSGSASQNRFNLLFQKFIQVLTTPEHPLVIFLDDLQWADSASLDLMQLLMSETETGYLLLIGAYRDNEVSPAHPLMLVLNDIGKTGAVINTITLTPLQASDLNHLIADTLSCPSTLAAPLTELVYRKTKGNPFFVTQLLKALHEEGWITFDIEKGYWQGDIAQIQELTLTDDVVEFMAHQIQKLPTSTQCVLKLAACIGNSFDLTTLAIVYEKSPDETAVDLWRALQEGLILPTSEIYKFFQNSGNGSESCQLPMNNEQPNYKFLHDRVQQAAYFLIPEEQKQATHLKIGQLLLKNTTLAQQDEKLFEIVNQFNIGKNLITVRSQQTELAQLNLQAGQKARAATAYTAAFEYLCTGIALLPQELWQKQYQLTLALYEAATEAAYLSGNLEQMPQFAAVILEHASTLLDTVKVYEIKIQAAQAQHQFLEAVQIALEILECLGISFPQQPSESDIAQACAATNSILAGRQPLDLITLPQMTEPEKIAAIRILANVSSSAYVVAPSLLPFIILEQVNLSVQYGNISYSANGYAYYGLMLCGVIGDIECGYQFGQLAHLLLERLNAKEMKARTYVGVQCSVWHWKQPLQNTLAFLRQGYQSGLETGDLESATICAFVYVMHSWFVGKELGDLSRESVAFRDQLTHLKQEGLLSHLTIFQQAILNLIGDAPEAWQLIGNAFDQEQMLPIIQRSGDQTALCYFYVSKLILCYTFGKFELAVEAAIAIKNHLGGATGLFIVPVFHTYDSLAHLAIYSEVSQAEQKSIQQRVVANQEKIKKWADHIPANHLHKYYLVEAERHRILGNKVEAVEYYDLAIALAQENQYLNEEALANELAARFYLGWGKERLAQDYLLNAYYAYSRWGAKAKVEDLERDYPHLLAPILQQDKIEMMADVTISTIDNGTLNLNYANSTTSASSGVSVALDLATILKASHTLSSEIQLEKLLSTLLNVVIENAGADKCVLLLLENQRLLVEAITTVGESSTVMQSLPLEDSQDLPISLINQVKRTLQPSTIINATTHPLLMGDAYIIRQQPKSLLCIPIIHQGKLLGILYLENRLTTGVFTSDRVEILNLLCTQAAIALENAHLYQQAQTYAQQVERSLAQQKTLFNVVTQMRESLDLDAIFCAVTQNIRPILNADRVGIYQFHLESGYEYGEFIAEDVLPAFPSALAIKIQDHCFGENYATLYKQGRFCAMADLQATPVLDCHRVILEQFKIRASLVVPIMQDNELWGLLCIHQCAQPRHWQTSEIQFAKQIAAQMGVALQQTELLIKTRQQSTQLEQTLHYLQETQLQLVQNEKMSALGNLVAGVAHEINNPVGFIAGNLKPAEDYVQDLFRLINLYQEKLPNPGQDLEDEIEAIDLEYIREDLPKLIDSMKLGVNRIHEISNSLRTFSRSDKDYKVPFNLHDGIDSTILILKHRLKPHDNRPAIEVVRDYGNLPQVECFAGQLNQVFMNLLANAIDALEESHQQRNLANIQLNRHQIIIKTRLAEDGQQVLIRIADNGIGMPEEVKQRVFDYLFTTKSVGQGTGLGLAIAQQIVVERHGGTLKVDSVLGQGTEFTIILPVAVKTD